MSLGHQSNQRLVDWAEYVHLIETLASLVKKSGYVCDHLVCVARGGLLIGDIFSRLFQKPLHIAACSSYRHQCGQERGDLLVADAMLSVQFQDLCGRVLLLDDLVDSGGTLSHMTEKLRLMAGVTEVRTAVLWHKVASILTPDFLVEKIFDETWIVQPFEVYDELG
jgi:hypoxanthine phosphoribosyltransferase